MGGSGQAWRSGVEEWRENKEQEEDEVEEEGYQLKQTNAKTHGNKLKTRTQTQTTFTHTNAFSRARSWHTATAHRSSTVFPSRHRRQGHRPPATVGLRRPGGGGGGGGGGVGGTTLHTRCTFVSEWHVSP